MNDDIYELLEKAQKQVDDLAEKVDRKGGKSPTAAAYRRKEYAERNARGELDEKRPSGGPVTVRAHISHSKTGKVEQVKEHQAKRNPSGQLASPHGLSRRYLTPGGFSVGQAYVGKIKLNNARRAQDQSYIYPVRLGPRGQRIGELRPHRDDEGYTGQFIASHAADGDIGKFPSLKDAAHALHRYHREYEKS